ncbi:hypothetical protein [Streptomyces sp. S186]|uniref:hypothetical protein n=1 Tax=Streptomyces sp. S186 TaxID=3434395 RepID=UPI003F670D5B
MRSETEAQVLVDRLRPQAKSGDWRQDVLGQRELTLTPDPNDEHPLINGHRVTREMCAALRFERPSQARHFVYEDLVELMGRPTLEPDGTIRTLTLGPPPFCYLQPTRDGLVMMRKDEVPKNLVCCECSADLRPTTPDREPAYSIPSPQNPKHDRWYCHDCAAGHVEAAMST